MEVTRWHPRRWGGITTVFWAHLAAIESDDLLGTAVGEYDFTRSILDFFELEQETEGTREKRPDTACIALCWRPGEMS